MKSTKQPLNFKTLNDAVERNDINTAYACLATSISLTELDQNLSYKILSFLTSQKITAEKYTAISYLVEKVFKLSHINFDRFMSFFFSCVKEQKEELLLDHFFSIVHSYLSTLILTQYFCTTYAMGFMSTEYFKEFLNKYPEVNSTNLYQIKETETIQNSLVDICIAKNDIEPLRFLIDKKNIDINASCISYDGDEYTPLLRAVVLNHFQIVELLLSIPECDVNKKSSKHGQTALHFCFSGVATQTIIGAKKATNDGINSPKVIPEKTILPLVESLLSKNVDLSLKSEEGSTAFYCAVSRGYHNSAFRLIEKGFNPTTDNQLLFFLTNYYVQFGSFIPLLWPYYSNHVIEEKNSIGESLLFVACQDSDLAFCSFLLSHLQDPHFFITPNDIGQPSPKEILERNPFMSDNDRKELYNFYHIITNPNQDPQFVTQLKQSITAKLYTTCLSFALERKQYPVFSALLKQLHADLKKGQISEIEAESIICISSFNTVFSTYTGKDNDALLIASLLEMPQLDTEAHYILQSNIEEYLRSPENQDDNIQKIKSLLSYPACLQKIPSPVTLLCAALLSGSWKKISVIFSAFPSTLLAECNTSFWKEKTPLQYVLKYQSDFALKFKAAALILQKMGTQDKSLPTIIEALSNLENTKQTQQKSLQASEKNSTSVDDNSRNALHRIALSAHPLMPEQQETIKKIKSVDSSCTTIADKSKRIPLYLYCENTSQINSDDVALLNVPTDQKQLLNVRPDGAPSLAYFIVKKGNVSLLRKLAKDGMDINAVPLTQCSRIEDISPLFSAISNVNSSMVEALFELGAQYEFPLFAKQYNTLNAQHKYAYLLYYVFDLLIEDQAPSWAHSIAKREKYDEEIQKILQLCVKKESAQNNITYMMEQTETSPRFLAKDFNEAISINKKLLWFMEKNNSITSLLIAKMPMYMLYTEYSSWKEDALTQAIKIIGFLLDNKISTAALSNLKFIFGADILLMAVATHAHLSKLPVLLLNATILVFTSQNTCKSLNEDQKSSLTIILLNLSFEYMLKTMSLTKLWLFWDDSFIDAILKKQSISDINKSFAPFKTIHSDKDLTPTDKKEIKAMLQKYVARIDDKLIKEITLNNIKILLSMDISLSTETAICFLKNNYEKLDRNFLDNLAAQLTDLQKIELFIYFKDQSSSANGQENAGTNWIKNQIPKNKLIDHLLLQGDLAWPVKLVCELKPEEIAALEKSIASKLKTTTQKITFFENCLSKKKSVADALLLKFVTAENSSEWFVYLTQQKEHHARIMTVLRQLPTLPDASKALLLPFFVNNALYAEILPLLNSISPDSLITYLQTLNFNNLPNEVNNAFFAKIKSASNFATTLKTHNFSYLISLLENNPYTANLDSFYIDYIESNLNEASVLFQKMPQEKQLSILRKKESSDILFLLTSCDVSRQEKIIDALLKEDVSLAKVCIMKAKESSNYLSLLQLFEKAIPNNLKTASSLLPLFYQSNDLEKLFIAPPSKKDSVIFFDTIDAVNIASLTESVKKQLLNLINERKGEWVSFFENANRANFLIKLISHPNDIKDNDAFLRVFFTKQTASEINDWCQNYPGNIAALVKKHLTKATNNTIMDLWWDFAIAQPSCYLSKLLLSDSTLFMTGTIEKQTTFLLSITQTEIKLYKKLLKETPVVLNGLLSLIQNEQGLNQWLESAIYDETKTALLQAISSDEDKYRILKILKQHPDKETEITAEENLFLFQYAKEIKDTSFLLGFAPTQIDVDYCREQETAILNAILAHKKIHSSYANLSPDVQNHLFTFMLKKQHCENDGQIKWMAITFYKQCVAQLTAIKNDLAFMKKQRELCLEYITSKSGRYDDIAEKYILLLTTPPFCYSIPSNLKNAPSREELKEHQLKMQAFLNSANENSISDKFFERYKTNLAAFKTLLNLSDEEVFTAEMNSETNAKEYYNHIYGYEHQWRQFLHFLSKQNEKHIELLDLEVCSIDSNNKITENTDVQDTKATLTLLQKYDAEIYFGGSTLEEMRKNNSTLLGRSDLDLNIILPKDEIPFFTRAEKMIREMNAIMGPYKLQRQDFDSKGRAYAHYSSLNGQIDLVFQQEQSELLHSCNCKVDYTIKGKHFGKLVLLKMAQKPHPTFAQNQGQFYLNTEKYYFTITPQQVSYDSSPAEKATAEKIAIEEQVRVKILFKSWLKQLKQNVQIDEYGKEILTSVLNNPLSAQELRKFCKNYVKKCYVDLCDKEQRTKLFKGVASISEKTLIPLHEWLNEAYQKLTDQIATQNSNDPSFDKPGSPSKRKAGGAS
jgi:ankyrin repeat protein